MNDIVYKGYTIAQSSGRGGKAGRGKNRTLSIQVREPAGPGGYFLKRHWTFAIDDTAKRDKLVEKAKAFIDASVQTGK